jgi:DNA helicase-2/ATP-dependent DNA helicase PcrA
VEETVIKKEYQEKIAKVICDKSEQITCDECYLLAEGKICRGFKRCRISEKTVEQLEYVMAPKEDGIFLKACAGSGKTEVVALKTAYEMKQWKSYNQGMAVLTFTNDATNVILERVKQFTGKSNIYPHYIGTLSSFIHSYIVQPFAYEMRGFKGREGDFSFRIVDRNMPIYTNHWLKAYTCKVSYIDSQNNWHQIYAHQIGYDMEKKDFYFYIGKNKIEWLSNYYASVPLQSFIREKRNQRDNFWKLDYISNCFRDCKESFWKDGFATFDDLNSLAAEILLKNIGKKIAQRFPFVFIDECQDLSGNELKVIQLLQKQGCSIHCIGDLNQSIYEFKRVEPNEIEEYVRNYRHMELNINFRSCDEIVKFSEKLINSRNVKSANEQSIFGARSLVYIEYETPEDCVGDYAKLLEKNNCMTGENRILVRQNSLRLQLEKSTHNDYDEKEPLIVAAQLWQQGSKLQMTLALELAGKQISRWFGGSRTKSNYYCPQEIVSVFQWRIFLMKVLMEILQSRNLSNFKLTYGKWHEYARKELGDILRNNYPIVADYDDVKDRDFNNLITGKTFKVSSGNGSIVIGDLDEKAKSVIPIMTIHGSKGCTFDTTLVISSKDAKSIGGHWKKHWLNGEGEAKRIGYVASTRARHMLVWGVPKLNDTDRELLESYGFINVKKII